MWPWKRRPRANQLACMRLADMAVTRPDQDNSRVCAKCGETVGIYPSGQRVLRDNPDALIICHVCAGPFVGEPAPGALDEARMRSRSDGRRLPKDRCSQCGRVVTAATLVGEDGVRPSPGDFAMCLECTHVMAYDDKWRLRELTDAERTEADADPEIAAMREAKRAADRMMGRRQ